MQIGGVASSGGAECRSHSKREISARSNTATSPSSTSVGPLRLRVESLRHLGWRAYQVERYQNWCGHTIQRFRSDRGAFHTVERSACSSSLTSRFCHPSQPLRL